MSVCAAEQIVNHFCTSLIRAQESRPNHVNTPSTHTYNTLRDGARHIHPCLPRDREEVIAEEEEDSKELRGMGKTSPAGRLTEVGGSKGTGPVSNGANLNSHCC